MHLGPRPSPRKTMYWEVKLASCDLDVLERFQEIIGCGRIYDHRPAGYRDNPKNRRSWIWKAAARQDTIRVITLLGPYFGERRKVRALELIDHLAPERVF